MNSAALADAPARQSRAMPCSVVERPRLELRQPLVALRLALPTALLLYCCFFPVACGWLAWGALVPLLLLARSRMRPITIYTITFIAGLVFYWPVLQWMRVADPAMYFAWGILATYCALYFPIGLYFIRYLDRRTSLPLAVSAPLVWTALEYLRSQLGTGFSWYLIGHTQHDCLSVIQIADLAGAFGVTFLVVMVNGLLAELVFLHPAMRRFVNGADTPVRYGRTFMLVQMGLVAALLLATCGYGAYRLGQNDFGYGPRIALIQGNLDQRIRNDANMAQEGGSAFRRSVRSRRAGFQWAYLRNGRRRRRSDCRLAGRSLRRSDCLAGNQLSANLEGRPTRCAVRVECQGRGGHRRTLEESRAAWPQGGHPR